MKYFVNVKTIEELRREYKKLVFKLHPDKGGNEEDFKNMVNEYERLFKILPNKENEKAKEKEEKDFYYDKKMRNVFESLMSFSGLEIEIVGSWLWVYGDTKPIKEELKNLGLFWSGKHICWMYNGGKKESSRRTRMKKSDIVEKYGNTSYKSKGSLKLED